MRIKNYTVVLIVLVMTGTIWFGWPWVSEFCGKCHALLIPGIHDQTSREELSQSYAVFQALMAILTIGMAIATYWLGKWQTRDDEFHQMLVKEMEHVFSAVEEWGRLQDELVWNVEGKELDGSFVLGELVRRYRADELRVLGEFYGKEWTPGRCLTKEQSAALAKIDRDFMRDFQEANLKPLANALFRILNWTWAVVGTLERIYAGDSFHKKEIAGFQEKAIGIVRDYISPSAQFVFGKYRHAKWSLESAFPKRRKPMFYRGERAADRLFMYERTLALYDPDPEVMSWQLQDMDRRRLQEGLAEDLKIDFRKIWIRNG